MIAIAVLGFGMAISVAPLTTTVIGAVKVEQAGTASGINNAVARTASLLAIAIFSLIVSHTFNSALDTRLTQLQIPPSVQQMLAGAEIPPGLSEAVASVLKSAIAQSFVSSFRLVMLIASGLAIISAIVAALMIKPQDTPSNSP